MWCRGAACSTQSSIRIQTHHSTATGTIAKASTARLWSCSGFIGSADPQPEQNTRESGSEQPIKPSELERCGSHQARYKQDCEAAKRHKSRVLRLETVRAKRIRQSKEPSHAQGNGGLALKTFWVPFGCPPEGQSLRSQSGRQDSNLRPSAPKAPALPSCATPRVASTVGQSRRIKLGQRQESS